MGLSAASIFIGAHFGLASNFSTKDLTPLDVFLLATSLANYLLVQAVMYQVSIQSGQI